jgi:hypothetical protein
MVKGMMKTLEASLSIVIVLSSIVFLFPGSAVSSQPSYDAYNCLRQMDNEGSLGYFAQNNMQDELNARLAECIPVTFNYTAKICATSCGADLPSKTVTLSSYMVAGSDSFSPAMINVWVWSK